MKQNSTPFFSFKGPQFPTQALFIDKEVIILAADSTEAMQKIESGGDVTVEVTSDTSLSTHSIWFFWTHAKAKSYWHTPTFVSNQQWFPDTWAHFWFLKQSVVSLSLLQHWWWHTVKVLISNNTKFHTAWVRSITFSV